MEMKEEANSKMSMIDESKYGYKTHICFMIEYILDILIYK